MTWLTVIIGWAICDVLFASTWAMLFELGREQGANRNLGRETLKLDASWYSLVA
jgi:hypothetical protein